MRSELVALYGNQMIARSIIALALAAGVFVFAVRIDLGGTMSNLAADVLIAAAISVGIRRWLVRRARADAVAQFLAAFAGFDDWLTRLQEDVDDVHVWSLRRVTDQTDPRELLYPRPDAMCDSWFWNKLIEKADDFAAEQGTADLEPALRGIEEKYQAMRDQFAVATNALSRPRRGRPVSVLISSDSVPEQDWYDANEANSALADLHSRSADVCNAIDKVRSAIQERYSAGSEANNQVPDPFPRWVTPTTSIAALVALTAFISSGLCPSRFPAGFAHGVINNLLTGLVVVLVSAAITQIANSLSWQRRVARTKEAVMLVGRKAMLVMNSVRVPDSAQRAQFLHETAKGIADLVNQLQHVRSDARLQGYTRLLLELVEKFADGGFEGVDARQERWRIEGLGELYPPTQQSLRMTELALRVYERASAVYLHGDVTQ